MAERSRRFCGCAHTRATPEVMGTALTEADAPVNSTPSLRRLWSMYKKLLNEDGMTPNGL
jgi:hypothetical protein